MDSQMVFQRAGGITDESFYHAAILLQAKISEDQYSRAQIGFENVGVNAGVLWLDTDGKLKFSDNTGSTVILQTTPQ